jgi:hypothetical protein
MTPLVALAGSVCAARACGPHVARSCAAAGKLTSLLIAEGCAGGVLTVWFAKGSVQFTGAIVVAPVSTGAGVVVVLSLAGVLAPFASEVSGVTGTEGELVGD